MEPFPMNGNAATHPLADKLQAFDHGQLTSPHRITGAARRANLCLKSVPCPKQSFPNPFFRQERTMSPRPIGTRLGAVMAVVLFAGPAALGNGPITEKEVEQHLGIVTAVKTLKGRRLALTVTADQKESTFTLDTK